MNPNNPFIFKNFHTKQNIASAQPIQHLNINFIKSWVDNLNINIICDERLLFEYYTDDNSIFLCNIENR